MYGAADKHPDPQEMKMMEKTLKTDAARRQFSKKEIVLISDSKLEIN